MMAADRGGRVRTAGGRPAARKGYSLSLMMRLPVARPSFPLPLLCEWTAMEMDGAGLASGGSCGGFFSLSESDTATTSRAAGFTRRG